MATIAVYASHPDLQDHASKLARELGLPLLANADPHDFQALLQLTPQGLQLQPCGSDASGPVMVDFGSGAMRHRRRAGHMELLGRAVGAGKREALHVVDATAGLGRDSFVLADGGCRVTMIEQSPPVHALLRDGLARALNSEDARLVEAATRMELFAADACHWLRQLSTPVDVIYLDPMFPPRSKSARVKKEMWLFQNLLEEMDNPDDLLSLALDHATYRVVVKRPLKAQPLGGSSPGFSLKGKSVRFDVYSLRKL
jgi:16S rRNA (guanine1516-N2)-methyltransferase